MRKTEFQKRYDMAQNLNRLELAVLTFFMGWTIVNHEPMISIIIMPIGTFILIKSRSFWFKRLIGADPWKVHIRYK